MPVIIKVKNKTDWVLAFFSSVALIVISFIILILIPLMSAEETYFLSALSYISKIIPTSGFFTLFLYLWLWNIFGTTIILIEHDSIILRYKNKLFTKPKTFYKQEIKEIDTIDLRIENYKLGTRYHFSWTEATYSIVLVCKDGNKRIIDWITKEEADKITDKIKKIWYHSQENQDNMYSSINK